MAKTPIWVASVDLGNNCDLSEINAAVKLLSKKGATTFRMYTSRKSDGWGGDTTYMNLNGYKEHP